MKTSMYLFWQKHKNFAFFLFFMFAFRSAIADWSDVPTGSMEPTIQPGDRIVINKMAYDVRIPFTMQSLIPISHPKRGDIIVFDSARADKRLVKRVIGVPGDVVRLSNNRLHINDVAIAYETPDAGAPVHEELLFERPHLIQTDNTPVPQSSFGPVRVPQDHYLVLGDNRDHSADSRFYGFVPRREIIGKAHAVAFSLNYDNNYLPRSERWFQAL